MSGGTLLKDFDESHSRCEVTRSSNVGRKVVGKLNENGQHYGQTLINKTSSHWSDMDLSYLKNYIYEAPRETFEPSYQEKSDIYKTKGNKVYEHIKKEIDSRSKKVKSSEKNSNTYQVAL